MPGGGPGQPPARSAPPFQRAAGEEKNWPGRPFSSKNAPKSLGEAIPQKPSLGPRLRALCFSSAALPVACCCRRCLGHAAGMPAAMRPCFWHARRPPGCSNELASCHRCVIMTRSPCLRGVSCTSVQPAAAERRLMVTPVNRFSDLHTSFPIDLKVIRA